MYALSRPAYNKYKVTDSIQYRIALQTRAGCLYPPHHIHLIAAAQEKHYRFFGITAIKFSYVRLLATTLRADYIYNISILKHNLRCWLKCSYSTNI